MSDLVNLVEGGKWRRMQLINHIFEKVYEEDFD